VYKLLDKVLARITMGNLPRAVVALAKRRPIGTVRLLFKDLNTSCGKKRLPHRYRRVNRIPYPAASQPCLLDRDFCWNVQRRTHSSVPEDPEQKQHQPDYWTNDGVIEGVWMFSRHGDRTPSRPLSPEHRRAEEAAFWITKLPQPDSASAFEAYSKYFPVEKLKGSGCKDTFIDVARNPFGFLTSKGLQQLSENGHRFFNRYNNHAYHLPECKQWRSAKEFLTVWDVQVYSTNYLRTIMSVQSFLDGMFGTHCYDPGLHQQDRIYDPAIMKEFRIPCVRTDYTDSVNGPLVKIKVRDLRNDPLNAFDRNPDLIADLVSEVMMSEDFFQRDGKAAPLAARLANILPGLVRRQQGDSSDFSTRAPSGINWVEAADHFVCRTAHDMKLARFSDFESDDRVEQTLEAMSHPTLAHLSWRFRKWYQHDRLLAVIAAPLLREIADQILQTPSLAVHERRPFVIYSCHDITILGLLYGIGADFLAIGSTESTNVNDTSGDDTGSWRFWPPYGSNLVFELVRVREGPPGPDSHVVRVLLNGKPVRSAKVNTTTKPDSADGPEGMLLVDDFEWIVSKLEEAGGHEYASILTRT
jgi:Histidine phosphatase superfamily (branch 2)